MTLDPLSAAVRMARPDSFRCVEVAEALGVSPSTLRRMARRNRERFGPTELLAVGDRYLWLYDEARVDELHRILSLQGDKKPGGRPLWTAEVRRERHAAQSAEHYWRGRSADLLERGDKARSAAASDRADRIADRLTSQRAAVRPW